MAGIVEKRMQPGAQPAPQEQEQETGTDPREQAQRSALMKAAGDMLYSDKGVERTIGMMQNSNVIDGAAHSVAYLMNAMAKELQAKGKQVSDDALLDVGQEVIERTLALGAEAGLIEFKSPEEYENAMNEAGEKALAIFHQMNQGQQPGQPAAQPTAQPQMQPGMIDSAQGAV